MDAAVLRLVGHVNHPVGEGRLANEIHPPNWVTAVKRKSYLLESERGKPSWPPTLQHISAGIHVRSHILRTVALPDLVHQRRMDSPIKSSNKHLGAPGEEIGRGSAMI